jgi:cytochrome P450
MAPDLDALLVSDTFFTDPYGVYERLREEAPVYWSEALQAWLVARHADVMVALRDPVSFSSFGWELRYLARLPEDVRLRIPELIHHHQTPNIITADPPLHTRLRRMVMRGFTPRAVEPLRERMEALSGELVTTAISSGSLDVIGDLAYPLPATIIAELLGVPDADRDRFKAWSVSQTRFFGTAHPDSALASSTNADIAAFRAYLRHLADQRRVAPAEDLITTLTTPDDSGATLTDEEILATLVIFLVAGHETTTNLIGNGVHALIRHPEQVEALRGDPGLLPAAIEEMLRFDPPVQRVRRRVMADLELGGSQLRAGDTVMLLLGSANRDPEVFEEPERFDICRVRPSHAAFGQGIHFCLGSGLARMEAPVAIAALLRACSRLITPSSWTASWNPSMTLRGLASLPLELAA